MTNQFESLRRPGVFGTVNYKQDCKINILNSQKAAFSVWASEISPAHWDFGFHAVSDQLPETKKHAGELGGWFDTPDHALLYALGHLKCLVAPNSDIYNLINASIKSLLNKSLF